MKNYIADPTANTAIANVDRERRRQERRGDRRPEPRIARQPERRAPNRCHAEVTVWRVVRFDEGGRAVDCGRCVQTDKCPEETPGFSLKVKIERDAQA